MIKISEKNGKKMGRPTENPRTEKIGFRMSKQEIEDIQICADKMNTQRVNAVVEGINLLKSELLPPDTDDFMNSTSDLTDFQFRTFMKMILEIIDSCKDKEEAIQKLESLIQGK